MLGGVFNGGTFRMNELEDFNSLYPLSINDVVSQRIANQIYEGLVKLDQKTFQLFLLLPVGGNLIQTLHFGHFTFALT